MTAHQHEQQEPTTSEPVAEVSMNGGTGETGEKAGHFGAILIDAAKLKKPQPSKHGERPDLLIDSNTGLLWDEMCGQIGSGPTSGLFRRTDEMVRVLWVGEDGYTPPVNMGPDDDDSPAMVSAVKPVQLAGMLSTVYRPCRIMANGAILYLTFPPSMAAMLHGRAADLPKLRPFRGVVHSPTLRADGTVNTEAGYDELSRTVFMPQDEQMVPVPDDPSTEQIVAARDLLASLIEDFPFATVHDRLNYLCMLITPVMINVLPPPWPMLLLNAPMAGSGKTLLADIVRILYGGMMRTGFAADDENEVRKSITTAMDRGTGGCICWDNLSGTVKSPDLAYLLTGKRYVDRRLGVTGDVDAANNRLIIGTGNNISVGGDIPRRVLWSTVDPDVPRPQDRTDFAIKDLAGYVEANRVQIIAAALTLARAWIIAGRPPGVAVGGQDTYATWRTGMAGLLAVAGFDGVLGHRDTDRAPESADGADWPGFLATLYGYEIFRLPFKAATLRIACDGYGDDGHGQAIELDDMVPDDFDFKKKAPGWGKVLAEKVGHHFGEYVVRAAPDIDHSKAFYVSRPKAEAAAKEAKAALAAELAAAADAGDY